MNKMLKKLIVFLLCFSMVLSNTLPCMANVIEEIKDNFESSDIIVEASENIDSAIENEVTDIDNEINENVDICKDESDDSSENEMINDVEKENDIEDVIVEGDVVEEEIEKEAEECEPEDNEVEENNVIEDEEQEDVVECEIEDTEAVKNDMLEEPIEAVIENANATPSEIIEDIDEENKEMMNEELVEEEEEIEIQLSITTPSECTMPIQLLGTSPFSVTNDNQEGLRVIMNYHHLDVEDGVDEVTYDLASIGAADSGYISLKKDDSGKVVEVTIDSVVLNNFTPDPMDVDMGVLFIRSTEVGDYKINFKGTTNIIYEENPTTKEYGFMGFLLYLHGESTLHIEGVGSASIYTKGFYVNEMHVITYDEPTKVYYKNLYINTQTYDDVAFFTYSTQCFFDNVNMDVSSGAESTHCFMLGIGNENYDDDVYISRFKNCRIKAINRLTNNDREEGGYGYPSPSAFNCSYTDVIFENCDVSFYVPHIPVGEARGIFMLHGFLTIDGGKMYIKCGDEPIEDLKNLIILAGIQAVNLNIINNANVNIDCDVDTTRRGGAVNKCDAWGIIYSNNVLIENSTLNIKVNGPSPQGIYYYGTSSAIEHNPVGNVEIINTNLNIDLMGIADGYTCVGITGRRIYFNLDKGSNKSIHIKTKDTDPYTDVNFAVCAHKFNDNCFISISDGAYIDKTIGLIDMLHYAKPVYTFFEDSEHIAEENVCSEITIRAKDQESYNDGGSSGSSGGSDGYVEKTLNAERILEKMLTNNYLKEKVLDKDQTSQSYESSQINWTYDAVNYQWSASLITQNGNIPLNGFIRVHNLINNKVHTYYLHNGKMKIGWINTISGKWHYFDIGNQTIGEEVYGRNCIDDKWYYFDENGELIE